MWVALGALSPFLWHRQLLSVQDAVLSMRSEDETLNIIQSKLTNNEEDNQLITCTRTIMNQNYFRFNGKTYKRSDGIPMVSPTSAIFSEIFLQQIKKKHFHHLKSNHNINTIIQYVDDILMMYNHNKHIEEQIAQDLETIHINIEFTYESETNNSIDIEIYRMPSSNTIAIHRNSRHPHQQKLSIFNRQTHKHPHNNKQLQQRTEIYTNASRIQWFRQQNHKQTST